MTVPVNALPEVLKLKDEDVTKELFIRWFSKTTENMIPKFNANDDFILRKGMTPLYKDDLPVVTTIGRWIFNVFLNYSIFKTQFPYFNNEDATKFHKQVSYAFIEGTITREQHSLYQTKKAWLEYTPTEILVPGLSFNMIRPHPLVMKRKAELFKKYEKELAKGGNEGVVASVTIEKELLAYAREVNKDDPSLRLFDLKDPSFGNHYKNMSVMIGAQRSNTDPSEFHISSSNFVDGINKEEFASHADQLILGTYSRSVETQKGGAAVKEMNAAFESEQCNLSLDSDCHTQLYNTITITDKNVELFLFHFVYGPKGLIQILPSNQKEFVGKTWKMRSVLYCNDEFYCAKCTGTLFQRAGIKDVGLTIATLGSVIQGLSMKRFHNTTVQATEMDWDQFFSD